MQQRAHVRFSQTGRAGEPDEASRAKGGPLVGPFVVSQHFTPSGFMGDGSGKDVIVMHVDDASCRAVATCPS